MSAPGDTDPAPAAFPADHALDEQQIRTAICLDGKAAVGTGSTGPAARQDAYALRLFPEHEDARLRAQMADAMYSCGLNALACWRATDIDAPELHEPYSAHVGAALAWLGSIAQRMGAYVPLRTRGQCDAYAPRPGDVLVVDGPVHVIVLTDTADTLPAMGDAPDFVTSEGGHPEISPSGEHGMGIISRTLRLRRTVNGLLQTGSVDARTGAVTWGRVVLYAVDAGLLRRSSEQA